METEKRTTGFFLITRGFLQSDLWLYKPDSWSKIWIYIIERVNWEDGKKLKRGEGYFNFAQEYKNIGMGITPSKIKSAVRYFKENAMIATTKTTRGMFIKVLNYDKYQTLSNHITTSPTTTQQLHNNFKTTTISKDNKDNKRNKSNTSNASVAEPQGVQDILKVFYEINPTLQFGNKTQRKACVDLINRFTLPEAKRMAQAVISVQGKPYAPTATTPWAMWNKLADFKVYFDKEKAGGGNGAGKGVWVC